MAMALSVFLSLISANDIDNIVWHGSCVEVAVVDPVGPKTGIWVFAITPRLRVRGALADAKLVDVNVSHSVGSPKAISDVIVKVVAANMGS
jgi:hypothetical protein